ncbi:MAG TPA: helix-turn-helix domain-containing protein [Solirubrobacterales bacterium]|nr:helix-turn-helix domain-containing protein [Solirubrobacterales bacterium]
MTRDAALRGIQKAVKQRSRADDDLRRYCREAKAAGVPITQIAEAAGLSRPTVYAYLGD